MISPAFPIHDPDVRRWLAKGRAQSEPVLKSRWAWLTFGTSALYKTVRTFYYPAMLRNRSLLGVLTAELVSLTAPSERGRLVGFSDLCASFVAAGLALLGGLVYSGAGVTALALAAAALAAIPGFWLAARPKPVPLAVPD